MEKVEIGSVGFVNVKDVRITYPISILKKDAFLNSKAVNIELSSVDEYEEGIFSGCHDLLSIYLPCPSKKSLTNNIFGDDKPEKLSSVILGDGISCLGSTTLSRLPKLKNVQLPNSLKKICKSAFSQCNSIETLEIPRETTLESNVFSKMEQLSNLTFPLQNENINLGLKTAKKLKTLTICNVKSGKHIIFANQFNGIKAETVNFEDCGTGIIDVQDNAFKNCVNLQALNLENADFSVLHSNTLKGCGSLSTIRLPETLMCIEENSLIDTKITSVSLPESLKEIYSTGLSLSISDFPEDIEKIHDSAFQNCVFDANSQDLVLEHTSLLGKSAFANTNLKSIVLNCYQGNNSVYIAESCFQNCEQLVDFTVSMTGSPLRQIKENAFENCKNLTKFDFAGIQIIEKFAFKKTNLFDVNFNIIKKIDDFAFEDSSIKKICFSHSSIMSSQIGKEIFKGVKDVQMLSIDTTLEQFNEVFKDSLLCGQELKIDDDNRAETQTSAYSCIMSAFGIESTYALIRFTDIDLTNAPILKMASVANTQMFGSYPDTYNYKCLKYSDTTQATLTACDTTVDDFAAFQISPNLRYETTTIQTNAFNSARTQLTSLNIRNVQSIPANLFQNSTLANLSSHGQLTSIQANAFTGSSNLTSIDYLFNVKSIGDYAFKDCIVYSQLVTFEYAAESIGQYAFYNTNLTSIELPNTLTSLGQYSFANCRNLTTVKLHNASSSSKLSHLQQHTFDNDLQISELNIPSAMVLDNNSLAGMKEDLSIYLDQRDHSSANTLLAIDSSGLGNDQCGAAYSSRFMLDANYYIYPAYWVVRNSSDANIIKEVRLPAFDTILVENDLHLRKYDEKFAQSTDIAADKFQNISKVLSYAFKDAKTLITLTIPTTLTAYVEDNAFYGNTYVQTININEKYVESKHLHLIEKWFGSNDYEVKIHFEQGILYKGKYYHDHIFLSQFNSKNQNTIYAVSPTNTLTNVTVQNVDVEIPAYEVLSARSFETNTSIKILDTGELKELDDQAFGYSNTLTSVTLNGNLVQSRVSEHAFDFSHVKNVIVQKFDGTTSFTGYGLNNTDSLNDLTVSNGWKRIENSAMIDCNSQLTNIVFPSTLTSIGEYAFAKINNMQPYISVVNFSSLQNLQTIEKYAFYNSLKTQQNKTLELTGNSLKIYDFAFGYDKYVTIQEITSLKCHNVTYIGDSAFVHNHFKTIDLGSQLTTIDVSAFAEPRYKYQPFTIPSTIANINQGAFKDNVVLVKDNVAKNTIYIDKQIEDLSTIFDVSITDKFKAFNRAEFTDHTCLSALRTEDPYVAYCYIYKGLMHFCPTGARIDIFTKTLVQGQQDAVDVFVPEYVTRIGPAAFKDVTTLRSLLVEDEVEICESAFYNCINFEHFNTGKKKYYLKNTSDYMFYNCNKLENILLLSTVVDIAQYAFYNCYQLTSMYGDINNQYYKLYSLSGIEDYAYCGCSSLISADICQNLSTLGYHTYKGCLNLENINIELDSVEFVRRISSDAELSSLIIERFGDVRPDKTNCYVNFLDVSYTIDGYPKIDNNELVVIENKEGKNIVKKVDYDKFTELNRTYLYLSSISEIADFAFCNIQTLKNISFLPNLNTGEDLTSIGDFAFAECRSLMNISRSYLTSVKHVGTYAFSNCIALTHLTFDFNMLQSIEAGAFSGSNISDIDIMNCDEPDYLESLKTKFGIKAGSADKNPSGMPINCQITIYDSGNNVVGRYSYIFINLLTVDVDINRNCQVFVDKLNGSVVPVQIVQAVDPDSDHYPIIVDNTFHARIVGRWK